MTFKDLDQIPGVSRLAKKEFDFPGSVATLDTAEHMTNKYHQKKTKNTKNYFKKTPQNMPVPDTYTRHRNDKKNLAQFIHAVSSFGD